MDMGEALGNVEFALAPKRRRKLLPEVTTLCQNEYSSSDDEESEGHDDNIVALPVDDLRHIFRDETWNQTNFTYDRPPPIQFHRNEGTRSFYDVLPTLLQL